MNKWVIDNLLTQLYGDDGKLRNKFIQSVPNAKSYKVIIQGKEIPLMELTGLRKSVKSHWEILAYKNRPANRYLNHQVGRLVDSVTKPYRFWTIVGKLNLRSNVWFLVHLNKVKPNWYRALPLWTVLALNKKLKKIAAEFKGDVDFRRCYIPKTTGSLKEWLLDSNRKWRPLGVPTLVWRVYLSMLNTVLTIWLERIWFPQQHGYFPLKGTTTAWIEILKRLGSKNIYEFDLKQFFPSVQIGYVSKILRSTKMPMYWVEYFENLNKSQPKLTNEDKVDETRIRENIDISKGILNKEQTWYKPVREFIEANGSELWEQLVKEDTGGFDIYHEFEFIQLQWALFSSLNVHKGLDPHIGTTLPNSSGLPQGGGISPTLSVQVLAPLFKRNDAIMYADDGVIFGDPQLESQEYIEAGIVFHPDKSRYVKKDNVWLEELRFCGLVYNGWDDTLRSETRKGKKIQIEKDKLHRIISASEWYTSEGTRSKSNVWLEALSGRLGGFIQAIHYNGTYELDTEWGDWEVHATHTSWYKSKAKEFACKNNSYKTNLYNSSTLASSWLLNKLSKQPRGVQNIRKDVKALAFAHLVKQDRVRHQMQKLQKMYGELKDAMF